jgi:CBS-domain-containing membrane protein
MVSYAEVFWSWVGAFLGISCVSYLHYNLVSEIDMVMVVGSFGASAVLIYGAPSGPLSQPRNLIGGHFISALIGVACYQLLHEHMWLAAGMAVATAIGIMHVTKSLHPPGGATALIAVIGSDKVHQLGFFYVVFPVMTGAMIMLLIALLVNNIPDSRKYPVFWR